MKSVAYYSPFVPADWISAHGLSPMRRRPRSSAAPGISGVCPYAYSFFHEASEDPDVDAIVLTSDCDQIRRISELDREPPRRPIFRMHVPTTWQTTNAHRYYQEEVRRLGQFLVGLGGVEPTPDALAKEMLRGEAERRACLESATGGEDGIPLAILGGPLTLDDECLLALLTSLGARVVLDATDTGPRSQPATYDRRGLRDDPFLEMADAHFGAIPMVYRRPNHELFRWLEEELPRSGARGVVMRRCVWCDVWHAEESRVREWAKLPVITVDAAGEELTAPRTVQRLEAFVEMLR